MKKIKTTIIGASGYTGAELIRILYNHKNVQIVDLIAESNAGKPISQIYPHMKTLDLPDLIKLSDANFDDIELVFCCLPHATSQAVIKELPEHLKVIDLSADFRLYDTDLYEKWYGGEHIAKDLQKNAAYGLSELFADEIKNARIVACPGCYPTSCLLPLSPLVKGGLISKEDIIIDSKSGVTGAGRSAKQANLFSEINEGVKAYSICNHRHIAEIEQTLSIVSNDEINVDFTPQLVPMNRGILSTIYVKLAESLSVTDLKSALENFYSDKPFVHILDDGEVPTTRSVFGTNNCFIYVTGARSKGRAVIVSVIDNLAKGSSGQAVQNMNIMFGFDESEGLEYVPVFP